MFSWVNKKKMKHVVCVLVLLNESWKCCVSVNYKLVWSGMTWALCRASVSSLNCGQSESMFLPSVSPICEINATRFKRGAALCLPVAMVNAGVRAPLIMAFIVSLTCCLPLRWEGSYGWGYRNRKTERWGIFFFFWRTFIPFLLVSLVFVLFEGFQFFFLL